MRIPGFEVFLISGVLICPDYRPRQCPHPDAALRGQDIDVLAVLLGELYPGLANIRH